VQRQVMKSRINAATLEVRDKSLPLFEVA
jgi:hypothetical protein